MHIQLSLHNEIFIRKIQKLPFIVTFNASWLVRLVTSHVFIGLVNLHSDYAGEYQLRLIPSDNEPYASRLISSYSAPKVSTRKKALIWLELFRIFLSIGCLPLILLARKNHRSYHVAGTLPMKEYSDKPLTTDPEGRPYGFKNINVVDSATYPCLPGTTVGLIAMGNAYRIVKRMSLSNHG
jgi:choline dehydrogenase-like flavoprotein